MSGTPSGPPPSGSPPAPTPAPAAGSTPPAPPAPPAVKPPAANPPTAAPAAPAVAVPPKAQTVLNQVKAGNGSAPAGYKGNKPFANDGRDGGQVLPKTDGAGKPITYKEYDVNPFKPGVNRGAERVVVGSDGKAYYTDNHYTTFTPMP
jgi:guanyl-specific ribonuclease Sa